MESWLHHLESSAKRMSKCVRTGCRIAFETSDEHRNEFGGPRADHSTSWSSVLSVAASWNDGSAVKPNARILASVANVEIYAVRDKLQARWSVSCGILWEPSWLNILNVARAGNKGGKEREVLKGSRDELTTYLRLARVGTGWVPWPHVFFVWRALYLCSQYPFVLLFSSRFFLVFFDVRRLKPHVRSLAVSTGK